MKIAIQCSDLDAERIDGTRVYIWEVLNRLGGIAPDDRFFLYHRADFNPALTPKNFPNYEERRLSGMCCWTQTRLAFELLKARPDRLWMPVQGMPLLRPGGMETIVTIHDLAFRKFPQHFPKDDLRRLLFLSDVAIRRSDRIIAVSQSTKRDILHYFPNISEKKVSVVYHGYESKYPISNIKYQKKNTSTPYLLYVGAIQPRKNLETLVSAFETIKRDSRFGDLRLVIAGERAWLWEGTIARIEASSFRSAIDLKGRVTFAERENLYAGASAFVFPSLYEGFGLPILEAFAHTVPVVCAKNSSLPEVGGDGALYFEATSSEDLARVLARVLEDESLRSVCVQKGLEQLAKFSWEKCARETLLCIQNENK